MAFIAGTSTVNEGGKAQLYVTAGLNVRVVDKANEAVCHPVDNGHNVCVIGDDITGTGSTLIKTLAEVPTHPSGLVGVTVYVAVSTAAGFEVLLKVSVIFDTVPGQERAAPPVKLPGNVGAAQQKVELATAFDVVKARLVATPEHTVCVNPDVKTGFGFTLTITFTAAPAQPFIVGVTL